MDQILKSIADAVQASGGNGDLGEQRLRGGFAGGVGVERPTEGVHVREQVLIPNRSPAQRVPGGVPSGRERLRDVHCVRLLHNRSQCVGNLARIGHDRLREDRTDR